MPHYILLNGQDHEACRFAAVGLKRELKKLGHPVIHESFMSPVKYFLSYGLGTPWPQLNTHVAKGVLNGMSGIGAARAVHSHLRGAFGPDVLGRWLEYRVLGLKEQPYFVVIDDAKTAEDVSYIQRIQHAATYLVRVFGKEVKGAFVPLPNPGTILDLRSLTSINAEKVVMRLAKEIHDVG